jgi:hypothetical protein
VLVIRKHRAGAVEFFDVEGACLSTWGGQGYLLCVNR